MKTFFLLAAIAITFATVVNAESKFQSCIDNRLTAVLSGKQIPKYVDVPAVSRTVLGKGNVLRLKEPQLKEFSALVLSTIRTKIVAKGGDYRNSTVTLKEGTTQSKALGYINAPDGNSYHFIATGDFEKCRFRFLEIEGMFRLSKWLWEQEAVEVWMNQNKLIR